MNLKFTLLDVVLLFSLGLIFGWLRTLIPPSLIRDLSIFLIIPLALLFRWVKVKFAGSKSKENEEDREIEQ